MLAIASTTRPVRGSCTHTPTCLRVRQVRRQPLQVSCFKAADSSQQTAAAAAPPSVSRQPPNSIKQTATARAQPPQLIKEEKASLALALQSIGLPADANAAELPQDKVAGIVSAIRRGVGKEEQDLEALEGAMLLAEQLFHAKGGDLAAAAAAAGDVTEPPQAVDMWQPIFASAGGFPRLLYIPVPEYFDMHRSLPDATAISISSVGDSIDASSSPDRTAAAAGQGGRLNIVTELGPLTTHFLGTCCWLDSTTFSYSIGTVRLDLGGRSFSFGLGPFKLQNELSFFLTAPGMACARSKLGGTMLLAAEPAKGKAYFDSW